MNELLKALNNLSPQKKKVHTATIQGKEMEVSLEKSLEIMKHGEDAFILEEGNIVRKPIIKVSRKLPVLQKSDRGRIFMADRTRVSELDFIYISYDEPNKEENWVNLKNKVPWAKRVDGVKGFDSAHKAAARLAETQFFISVDGDNVIDESFLLQTLDWDKTDPKAVHRWRAKNNINGLVYGNGGLVGWDKDTCLNMHTHENAKDKRAEIDFCWAVKHENLHNCYSTTVINTSARQAFVAGYREGVKMSLDQGKNIDPREFTRVIHNINLRILTTWMSVGADVDNGKYAMLGARMGCYSTTVSGNKYVQVRDLEKMADLFSSAVDDINMDLEAYGESIRQRLDLPVADYNEQDSKFFKFCMPQHINKGVQDREY